MIYYVDGRIKLTDEDIYKIQSKLELIENRPVDLVGFNPKRLEWYFAFVPDQDKVYISIQKRKEED